MKKYHEELKELYNTIQNNNGYSCGGCDECDRIYMRFIQIMRRIKCPSKEGIHFENIPRTKVDLSKMHCVASNVQEASS